ncbi:uncharacterized protein BYT42DRAFT_555077 [Radiomyces spectabilis]|uniref:uncharacterized protein n=1 Tax=Radiomyces spectabilis TaxID=64574 RepID=UPI00221F03CB|nr:uncharacterized protein BYT42DRAFT_555077 [Radiomyces spectabilis]KAI8390978.1 hypothetical protein BYT42DRAFT_555077 [Radiomyces spectabilis]
MVSSSPSPRSRWLPRWILQLFGYSSLAAAVISFAIYYYKKSTRQLQDNSHSKSIPSLSGSSTQVSGDDKSALPGTSSSTVAAGGWSAKLLGSVPNSRKKKEKLTISLKNTILWNPSSDVDVPNHAFHEHATTLLSRLSQLYDVYLLISVGSKEEQDQIQHLLDHAGLIGSDGLDKRKILFCSTEEGKIHIVRHVEPYMHVEGGGELDDGGNSVKKLQPFVPKLLWIATRGKYKEADKSASNIEVTDHILKSSLARRAGYEA